MAHQRESKAIRLSPSDSKIKNYLRLDL
jgi:hypothetical protein